MQAHLAALDLVYTGVIEDTRKSIERVGDLDPVTEDMLIGAFDGAREVPVVRARASGELGRSTGQ